MAWDTASLNLAATAIGGQTLFASLFNGDPAAAGTEVNGGSPAYARKALTFGAPSAGVVTAVVTFDVPSGATFNNVGVHTAVTAGTLKNKGTVAAETYGSQGTYQLTVTVPVTSAA